MKKIFVTGSAGFIGSHLVENLVKKNYKVKALVHYNSLGYIGNLNFIPKDILKEVEIIFGDVQDFDFIKKASKGSSVIMHLAALIGIPYSYEAVSSYINTNIIGTRNVLQAALENNVSQIIHTSTSEVYGSAEYVPMNEKHPLNAQSPYSATKISADKLAESYWRSFCLPVSTLRPFNTYGPRQSSRAIVPTIVSQLIKNNPQVCIGSGFPIRDFTYVVDTANAYVSMVGNTKSFGEVINVGSGKGVSINGLIALVYEIAGINKFKVKSVKERIRPKNSEVDRLICDNSKAKKILGWKPSVDLKTGLKEVISFVSDNRERYFTERYAI